MNSTERLDHFDEYLASALEKFRREETNSGLVELTMALQELSGWLSEADKKLNAPDGN